MQVLKSTLLLGCLVLQACGSGGSEPGTPRPSGGSSNGGASGVAGAGAATIGGQGSSGTAGVGTGGGSGAQQGGGAGLGGAGGMAGMTASAPTKADYLEILYSLNDLMIGTQIADGDNAGALVSPSTNPEQNPLHSRAAEAVYPLAVAYKHSQDDRYAKSAISLGNWLITVQEASGAWIEEWPAATGWDGTTADQLISMANAYVILKGKLTPQEDSAWVVSITRSADWVAANFPKGNINYVPTGAVGLLSANRALQNGKASWLTKAASLMDQTVDAINDEALLTGEGMGVDLGYNIAQSIGYIAMYGLMLPSPAHVDSAVELLQAHQHFMYPGGAIDNSWGTRNFKWVLESGTKTAPGVFFSFALLADKHPSFLRGAQQALSWLEQHGRDDEGWLLYGPHAPRHETSSPPSNYGTFARAQSIATAIEFGPDASNLGKIPADERGWLKHFTSVKTAVFRTEKIMATVTSYGEIGSYPRESMARGGSVSALWFEGYGSTGFLQVSSQTVYTREEQKHMPIEQQLLPLTPRIETISGAYNTNLFDDKATLAISQDASGVHATTGGALKNISGTSNGTTFKWTYDFGPDSYSKQLEVSSGNGLRIVEPFVDDTGNQYALEGTDSFIITTQAGSEYTLKVISSSAPYTLSAGTDRARFWSPFPGLDCYPLTITLSNAASYSIKYTVSQTK